MEKLNNLINKHLNPQNKLHENIILYKTLYSALDTFNKLNCKWKHSYMK